MHSKMSLGLALLILAAIGHAAKHHGHANKRLGHDHAAKRQDQGKFIFENRMGETVWVGSQGNPGKENLEGGGWEMAPGSQKTVNAAEDWAGRFWGRTKCDDAGQCQTGNCNGIQCDGRGGAPPATLAEFTLKGDQGQDFYDVSLVDGFNVKVSIEPTAEPQGGYRCAAARCTSDINDNCPDELRLTGDDGSTIGCKSACEAFGGEEYCCTGAHDKPETCKSSDWPQDYPKFFKDSCPDAYSYAYDDHKSTFTCENTNYKIIFG